ncbi:hypothetical protein C8J55DRAFT_243042 [Lentinula edodes]|uniref:Uncharacterized protein n=1 Tax=Lentinula lateritia TaxID=40482 RepID=A0A9W9DEB2_9AGAR|nr:hypothetical protein C8J55DRAFT_243042 [Lentinula edodes]
MRKETRQTHLFPPVLAVSLQFLELVSKYVYHISSNMNILFNRTPSSKRWIVIITGLAWTLFARKGHASPLPAIPEQPELGTAISNTNSSSSDYDYYYTNHTDSQIRPRDLQLDSRGVGLKKGLIRAAIWLNPDWAVLGFAYVKPEEGEVHGDGSSVQLGALKLPTMKLDATGIPFRRMYLLPKLGMPAQNPGNHYWTCLVYASKKNMKIVKPQMLYRSERELNRSSPPYTHFQVLQRPHKHSINHLFQ